MSQTEFPSLNLVAEMGEKWQKRIKNEERIKRRTWGGRAQKKTGPIEEAVVVVVKEGICDRCDHATLG